MTIMLDPDVHTYVIMMLISFMLTMISNRTAVGNISILD